jgi:hypothetical protein
MALNGSGIRDTARVLRISPTTVIAVLKKRFECKLDIEDEEKHTRSYDLSS